MTDVRANAAFIAKNYPAAFDAFTAQWFFDTVVPEFLVDTPVPARSGDAWTTTAKVRNVMLPAAYNHVFVPVSHDLAAHPDVRKWINEYAPGRQAEASDPPGVSGDVIPPEEP